MLSYDYHLHTSFSSDSDAPMEDMIRQAILLDLKSICFTEHHDMDWPENEDHFTFLVDTKSYQQSLYELREKYKNHIEILFGIELGLQPHLKAELINYTKNYPFDFVIGSSHLVDRMDPYYPDLFEKYSDEKAVFRRSFECILKNLEVFTDFDVCGHLDYIVRYAPNQEQYYNYLDDIDLIDCILKKCVEHQIGLEINTSGWKYGLSSPHPAIGIFKRYKELGGEIVTIGSDAHKPEHIAWGFERIPDFLREAGFSYFTIFKERKPIFLPLENFAK